MHTMATRWDTWEGCCVIAVLVQRPDLVVVILASIMRLAGGGSSFSRSEVGDVNVGSNRNRPCCLRKRSNAESEVAVEVDDERKQAKKDGPNRAGGGLMWSRPSPTAMKAREPKVKLWHGAKSPGMIVDPIWSRSSVDAALD